MKDDQKLIQYRQDLLQNHNEINVNDLGAGSKKLSQKKRTISSIAKNAGISKKRAKILYRIVNYFKLNSLLEIGTSLGIATCAMSLANKNAKITTLEGCKETTQTASDQFKKFELKNIHILIGNFNETLPIALKDTTFDLVYFDGNHQKESTIIYFEQCLSHIRNDSVFIFDDIYWSKGMSEAWNYIYNHPKVSISLDTFKWGIVFFRKEQPKQHFVIRV